MPPLGPNADDGGLTDYSGDFMPTSGMKTSPGRHWCDWSASTPKRSTSSTVRCARPSACRHGMEEMERLAIEEWRGASPVYGERLRLIMGIEGDDVEAIFKVFQLDPGFPHHYLDVRYEVVDEKHGFFELAYCGALMDAEPWGDKMVTGMCHHIEDGTFDVTAQAVNPKAHIRHVHRPPRVPDDRSPNCRWELIIDDDNRNPSRGGHHQPSLR